MLLQWPDDSKPASLQLDAKEEDFKECRPHCGNMRGLRFQDISIRVWLDTAA